MCQIEAYDRLNPKGNDDASSGGYRPLTYGSTKDVLVSLDLTLKLIDSWIKSFNKNYIQGTMIYSDKDSGLFKNTLVTIPEPKPENWKKTNFFDIYKRKMIHQ